MNVCICVWCILLKVQGSDNLIWLDYQTSLQENMLNSGLKHDFLLKQEGWKTHN